MTDDELRRQEWLNWMRTDWKWIACMLLLAMLVGPLIGSVL